MKKFRRFFVMMMVAVIGLATSVETAAQDSAESLYEKSLEYFKTKEYDEAVKCLKLSAKQGYAKAQILLGLCYDEAISVEKSDEEAVKWYRRAADQGDTIAYAILGNCYRFGIGVKKNDAEAVKWCRKAADQGYSEAQEKLGGIYYYSEDETIQNYEEAVKWFRLAAEQQNERAQYMLGICYHYGVGVAQDYDEAIKWYKQSIRVVFTDAIEPLEDLGEDVSDYK